MNTPFEIEEAVTFIRRDGPRFFESDRGRELIKKFDNLYLPKDSLETQQCDSILRMLKDYIRRENPPRPFSIAVFGPPGSGKSITVKKLAKVAGEGKIERAEEINLSQFNSPEDLGRAMLGIFSMMKSGVTRMVFFDEFDSGLNKEKLAWLKMFLAPMQDGVFYYDGKPIAIGKAIFVFAGGTANSFEEFNRKEDRDFVECKGPDFVSRLRGFINIQGLNQHGDEMILRRALVLYYLLSVRSKTLMAADGSFNVDEGLLKRLLTGAHYIHELRSLEAVLDMCDLSGESRFGEERLPSPEQLSLHVSRGTLDGLTIGIAAGQERASEQFFEPFAKEILIRGGNLAHGGDFALQGPMGTLVESLKSAPQELASRADRGEPTKRISNYLSYPTYLNPDCRKARTKDIEEMVRFVVQPKIQSDECDSWKVADLSLSELKNKIDQKLYFTPMKEGFAPPYDTARHLAWAIGLFRMRLRLVQDIDALIVIEGKSKHGWGRFPGVVEEVLLAIVHKRPLFIVGKPGGASRAIGRLLGLDQTQPCDFMFDDPENLVPDEIKDHPHYFTVPHRSDLPADMPKLGDFIREHGIETEHWVDNGLTKAENRMLFASDVEECVPLIVKGLTKLTSRGVTQSSGPHSPKRNTLDK